MASAPNVPGYGTSPVANAPAAGGSAPSTGGPPSTGGTSTTDPSAFSLAGFTQQFHLTTVQPGTSMPDGSSKLKATNPFAAVPGVPGAGADIQAQTPGTSDVISVIQQFNTMAKDANQLATFKAQAYQVGLTNTKNASLTQLALAWQTVAEEAAQEQKPPQYVLNAAVKAGSWNAVNSGGVHPNDVGAAGSGNPNSSPDSSTTSTSQQTTNTQSNYVSYLDPATVQGTLADAYQRLVGRNPTQAEYQAFLNSVYTYEDQANTGKFESKVVLKDGQKFDTKTGAVVDTTTGQPVPPEDIQTTDSSGNPTQTTSGTAPSGTGPTSNSTSTGTTNTQQNTITQRGLGTRGAQFLAGQDAMNNPEEGNYQAATTYFNAFIKALSGPAAGMQSSGPTAMAP